MKKCLIVIVTYNRFDFLKNLIFSIREQEYKDYQILCVNNSSTDGTKEWLDQQNDIITITQDNCGGAGGFFTGIKYAAEHDYEYVWVMDDDVLVMKDSLIKLIEKTNIQNGFLCSKVIDNNGFPCNVPAISDAKQSNGELCWNEFSEKGLIRVKRASFVSVLIPIKNIKELGLPYKEFFIWSDDSEYTNRISHKYPCYYVSDSIVVHKRIQNGILSILTEQNKNRIKNYYYFYRNYIFYTRRASKKEHIFCLLRVCRDLFKCILHFKYYKSLIILKAVFASIVFSPKIQFPN